MITLKFEILNPFIDRFENVWARVGSTPMEHKWWEAQVMKTNDLVSLDFRFTTQTDHSGIDLWLGLLGYSINFKIYDNRHWDYEKKRWCVYD